jgi:hypothetical protein
MTASVFHNNALCVCAKGNGERKKNYFGQQHVYDKLCGAHKQQYRISFDISLRRVTTRNTPESENNH